MPQNYMGVITSTIKSLTTQNQLTQADLAKTLGISQQAVSDRFLGRRPWTLLDLITIHATYGVEFPISALAGAR